MKTLDQARTQLLRQLDETGIPLATWARDHGFEAQTVRDLLRGKSKGRFGQSHSIAVALGIKRGVPAPSAAADERKAA